MAKYADIIVDISLEKLDRPFQYRIPPEMEGELTEGMQVMIPFGKRTIQGLVLGITSEPQIGEEKIRPIESICHDRVPAESQLIALAAWIRRNYGGTMNQALKTVLPVRKKSKEIEHKTIRLALETGQARLQLAKYEDRKATARARLLRELISCGSLDWQLVTGKLGVSSGVIRGMEKQGILEVAVTTEYRNPVGHLQRKEYEKTLNGEQQAAVDRIVCDRRRGQYNTYLLKGVTGSGKTEVYMELIAQVLAEGRQAIVLIPEIALTYQTVMRFYSRFGDKVSVMNSRLTAAERCDQFERARTGDVDIMIGPRSALFTPFPDLGLIIIDEEHEGSYKSESVPRYHARETAIRRAAICGASVVLGSATPSVDAYYQAMEGSYVLLELKHRAREQALPDCEVVDLRQELRSGNRSILSRRLQDLMQQRLDSHQQTMLFINRRGMAGFISCRACGYVVKCPHCDVSLTQHRNGRMVCHYCGYEEVQPRVCPSCGSKYISGFKAGTEKIEEMVKARFPQARVLRMDADTTKNKESYEQILQSFAGQEADVLIGTQMIVKGHDFPNVTLVGVLAADMSLHVNDFHASERTFQLLTQAAGRAGRGDLPGEVVIQTYSPDHFAIQTALEQNYEAFYRQEIAVRRLLFYPPVWNMLVILCTSPRQEELEQGVGRMAERLQGLITRREQQMRRLLGLAPEDRIPTERLLQLIGPADASVSRVNDIYRKVIWLKTGDYELLVACKDRMEHFVRDNPDYRNITVQFDFNPAGGF